MLSPVIGWAANSTETELPEQPEFPVFFNNAASMEPQVRLDFPACIAIE
jgi:hypothetical protein